MPTNSYFRTFDARNDQELLHSIVSESIQVTGYDVNYIPRTLVNEDTILGEDSISEYKDAYSVEMYIKSVDGFEGEGDLVSKFGLEVRDQIIFSMSRRAWEGLDIGTRPKEGDLIYFGLTNKLFQIMFVEHETPFYQNGALPTFDLTCELFTYSEEALDTGVDEIDVIEKKQSFVRTFELSSISGTFTDGETVTGGTSAITGEVARWDSATSYLYLINMTGTFTVGEILTGATSLATGTYSTKITTDETSETLTTIDAGTSEQVSSNKQFEIDADSVFDFSESNPFGENP
ncbi:MAG: hypothetical protein QGH83_14040 [Candidatus Pacebacteria bacterium]|jgi:hypothetical protein|nr:hypothetical protein [Candidatus Paceibacterota bacterium]